ncbi:Peroxisome chaperone and import receptor [Coemansia sp. S100]|nr:Peroxisome chaperone and import receptor [Coemansia sp. S100]
MANASTPPPTTDAELDELLDDVLDQFTNDAPKPKTKEPAPVAPPTTVDEVLRAAAAAEGDDDLDGVNFDEDFTRKLAQSMEALLKDPSALSEAGSESDEAKTALDQLLKQMAALQSDLGANNPAATAADSGSRVGEASVAGAEKPGLEASSSSSFQNKIKATMDKLKESADRAEADSSQGGGGDMMDELMRQMDQMGDDSQLDSLVDDVISQLMSKDVLQQPLKELDQEYPKYLEKNKDTLSAEDRERYEKQHSYVKQILAMFAESTDDSLNDPRIVELMQKMQDCGQPPNELLKILAPDMELDEKGDVKVPGAPPNCIVISDHGGNTSPSSTCALQLYEYQTDRLRAGYQRVAALKAKVRARQQLVAEAQQRCDDAAQSLARRRAQLQELKQGEAVRTERAMYEAQSAGSKRAAQVAKVSGVLRKDRGILANALCQVVGLQTAGAAAQNHGLGGGDEDDDDDEEMFFLSMDMDDRKRLFGLPWPGHEDWAKYPNDYINACVGHCIHIFSILAHYLHLDLPFHISKRGSSLYIRANWRDVDVGEAALSIADNNTASFVVGLSMLFFDIAYLCHRQGVRVMAERITDAVDNMREAVLSLAEHESETRQRVPLELELYSVVQEVMKMYVGAGRKESEAVLLRQQVHDVLRRLHLCDDAVDSVDYDDENWAII